MGQRLGRKFSNSTVTGQVQVSVAPSGRRKYKFTMECSCGNTYVLSEKALGRATEPCPSCRVAATLPKVVKAARGRGRPIAASRVQDHPLYETWTNMRRRCNNPNSHKYKYYGARGIVVCERWSKFEAFLADMGERPPGRTLDRVDNDGPYSPDNCRWATVEEQANNMRNNVVCVVHGESLTVAQWCRKLGVTYKALNKARCRTGLGYETLIEKVIERLLHPTK